MVTVTFCDPLCCQGSLTRGYDNCPSADTSNTKGGGVPLMNSRAPLQLYSMFVQDIETFSVLYDCWLTILSHPFDFLTTQCTFLSSI